MLAHLQGRSTWIPAEEEEEGLEAAAHVATTATKAMIVTIVIRNLWTNEDFRSTYLANYLSL